MNGCYQLISMLDMAGGVQSSTEMHVADRFLESQDAHATMVALGPGLLLSRRDMGLLRSWRTIGEGGGGGWAGRTVAATDGREKEPTPTRVLYATFRIVIADNQICLTTFRGLHAHIWTAIISCGPI